MMDINKHDSIIGTSQMLEKNYFRLTSVSSILLLYV